MTIKLKPRARRESIRRRSKDAEMEVKHIIQTVCDHFKISEDQIFKQSRRAEIIKPRHIAAYLILSRRVCTVSDIAYIFNQHDSTVSGAERRCQNAIDTETDVYQDITAISQKLSTGQGVEAIKARYKKAS